MFDWQKPNSTNARQMAIWHDGHTALFKRAIAKTARGHYD